MVEAAGLQIPPHISGGGLGFGYLLQMVSVIPAAAEFHEFKMFQTKDANGPPVPIEIKSIPFESIEGVTYTMEVEPVGHGPWMEYQTFTVGTEEALTFEFPDDFQARWIRFKTNKDCRATTWLDYN